MNSELEHLGKQANGAARQLMKANTQQKNRALEFIAKAIMDKEAEILAANAEDIETGREMGLSEALLDRLRLSHERLVDICDGIKTVIQLPDPVGEDNDSRVLENGLRISKRSIPIGVIGVIYESRPNVTVDIATLCLKSSNVAILRGGKESINSNRVLAEAVVAGFACGFPPLDPPVLPSPSVPHHSVPDRVLAGPRGAGFRASGPVHHDMGVEDHGAHLGRPAGSRSDRVRPGRTHLRSLSHHSHVGSLMCSRHYLRSI